MLHNTFGRWIFFNIAVLALLYIDLKVFHRDAHEVRLKEALLLSGMWIALALLFNLGIYVIRGRPAALEFFTGYLIEKSLSMDNIFVFFMIFSHFKVPAIYQHKVLLWGILGALIMRTAMIAAGVSLIHRFDWILYVFGAFLIITGIRMAFQKETSVDLEKNPVIRLFQRFIPIAPDYHEGHFFLKQNGRWIATPLLLALVVVEATDIMFAADSIPAIFAITKDPFIIYTSNIFAILGLRSLYFALAGVIDKFHYLKLGLSVILVFVGTKMMMTDFYIIPIGLSLGIVAVILAISVLASSGRHHA